MAHEDDRALACSLRAPVLSNGDLACAAQGRGQDVHREHMATWHASGGSISTLLSMVDAMVAVKLCFTRHPEGRTLPGAHDSHLSGSIVCTPAWCR